MRVKLQENNFLFVWFLQRKQNIGTFFFSVSKKNNIFIDYSPRTKIDWVRDGLSLLKPDPFKFNHYQTRLKALSDLF